MSPEELSFAVKAKAKDLGFHLVGIAPDVKGRDKEFYNWWVDQGFGANMFYLRAQKQRRKSLGEILPGARNAIVCALRFPGSKEDPKPRDMEERAYGKIARYALHEDYHGRLQPLLEELAKHLDHLAEVPAGKKSLAYVDTGAIPERSLAEAAGLGWIGKNAMLIHPDEGSYFWIGEVITTVQLAPDRAISDHCGKCRRCLDACPTGAIFEDLRTVDARKCLAYWNIEHRGAIPQEFREPMQDWLLGCDICQEVCPWNEHSVRRARAEEGPAPVQWISTDELLQLGSEEFRRLYKNSAVVRAKESGMKRNAEIVAKNWRKRSGRMPGA